MRSRHDARQGALSPRIPRARTKAGRPSGSFTQHRRIDKLREVLESQPRGLTLEEIAASLRVTQRSVRRYLRELDGTREHEKFDILESIETSPGGAHVWRIKPGERGRKVDLRRSQAYALLATRRALDILRGSALHDEVELVLGQIEKVARTPFRSQGAEISGANALESRFFWLPPTARSYAARGEDLDEVFRAVADLRVLRFRPRTRGDRADRGDRVVFQPYAMVVHRGTIHVLGQRRGRAEAEVVPFEAMTELRASETEHFDLPAGFDVDQFVHGELGIAPPTRARATVEFDARVADEIKSKKWNAQQKILTSPDGRVRLQIPLVNVDQLVAFVLSWGDAARVVDPPELVDRVAETLSRALQRYSS